MKRISLALTLAAAGATAFAANAGAGTFKGVVVAKDSARHAIAVASPRGTVRTVRVNRLRRVGSRVVVKATRRPDGTFRASRVSVKGRAHRARVHAVVVRRAAGRTLVSAGGTMLSIRAARRIASAGDDGGLEPGDVVNADVSINGGGSLSGRSFQEVGHTGLFEIEGKVDSLSPLKITVDHGATIELRIPATLTLPSTLAVGDQVEAIVQFENDVYTLVMLKEEQEGENQDEDDDQGADVDEDNGRVEAEGTVTQLTDSSITVQPGEHATPVTFAIPQGFDLEGVEVGSRVEAKGSVQNGTLTLTKLELKDESADDDRGGDDDQQGDDDEHDGDDDHGGGGDDDSGSGGGGDDD